MTVVPSFGAVAMSCHSLIAASVVMAHGLAGVQAKEKADHTPRSEARQKLC